MSSDEDDVLIAAAYLHNIGYAPTRADGFHPLDGTVHLRELGVERLAGLVAHHSGAETERVCEDLRANSCSSSASGRRLRTL
jgi:predicted HD phosphohydrolase